MFISLIYTHGSPSEANTSREGPEREERGSIAQIFSRKILRKKSCYMYLILLSAFIRILYKDRSYRITTDPFGIVCVLNAIPIYECIPFHA